MRKLFIVWQDPEKRRWYPVGRLSFEDGIYRFNYTKGALQAKKTKRFVPFGRMQDFNVTYESEELFPLFANRLLSEKRPEYQDYVKWLQLEQDSLGNKQLAMLAITGGMRRTDSLEILPCPIPTNDNKYEVLFFVHGLSHIDKNNINCVNNLKKGDRLFFMLDVQNKFDATAIILRTDDPVALVGYCPRYLTKDFYTILKKCGASIPNITIEQVNLDAPLQLRLLCKFSAPWPKSFQPCSDDPFEPLT